MRSGFAFSVFSLALVSALAVMVQNKVGRAPAAPAIETAAINDDELTGSIDRFAVPQPLALSDEQRGLIFVGVVNLPDIPDVDLPVRLVGTIPGSVVLQELPAMVTSKVPLAKDVRFVKLDDRILLVRPADRIIVGEIPRYRVWQ